MSSQRVLVALSGGVDSAVAAVLLQDAGYSVECLHMTNWQADDGYCDAAEDFRDARRVARQLELPLHRVDFSREYFEQVFQAFLDEQAAGRTPNPDVLCNRQIKFGVLKRYARRLGAEFLATGHYARLDLTRAGPQLLKGVDRSKDQSYFLHAVRTADLDRVLFPLGTLQKADVRAQARRAGLAVAGKKDSTGICFIGERPFASFLSRYLPSSPGAIVTADGTRVGEHEGLHFHTIGQRQGLRIGGLAGRSSEPWYVAAKRIEANELVVVQGREHPLLQHDRLTAAPINWIGEPPAAWTRGAELACRAKTRYRQSDAACTVARLADGGAEVRFADSQWAVTPGQYVVLYAGDRCLGGGRIETAGRSESEWTAAVQAS